MFRMCGEVCGACSVHACPIRVKRVQFDGAIGGWIRQWCANMDSIIWPMEKSQSQTKDKMINDTLFSSLFCSGRVVCLLLSFHSFIWLPANNGLQGRAPPPRTASRRKCTTPKPSASNNINPSATTISPSKRTQLFPIKTQSAGNCLRLNNNYADLWNSLRDNLAPASVRIYGVRECVCSEMIEFCVNSGRIAFIALCLHSGAQFARLR